MNHHRILFKAPMFGNAHARGFNQIIRRGDEHNVCPSRDLPGTTGESLGTCHLGRPAGCLKVARGHPRYAVACIPEKLAYGCAHSPASDYSNRGLHSSKKSLHVPTPSSSICKVTWLIPKSSFIRRVNFWRISRMSNHDWSNGIMERWVFGKWRSPDKSDLVKVFFTGKSIPDLLGGDFNDLSVELGAVFQRVGLGNYPQTAFCK